MTQDPPGSPRRSRAPRTGKSAPPARAPRGGAGRPRKQPEVEPEELAAAPSESTSAPSESASARAAGPPAPSFELASLGASPTESDDEEAESTDDDDDDDAAEARRRRMRGGKNYITPRGHKQLVEELTQLATVERPRVVREVSDAAAEGDRSENAAYIYGKRRLREIDRRMGYLTRRLRFIAVVQPTEQRKDRIFFGAIVELHEPSSGERPTYQIVGVDEFNVAEGRISWQSPLGQALLGKQVDESVRLSVQGRERLLRVVSIRYEG